MSKNRSEGKLDTVIGPDTGVKGDFQVTGSLRLDGRVEGKVEVSESVLSGPKSMLDGELHCRDAVIAGRVQGDVHATDTVELQTGSHVVGNIRCSGIIIQRDSFFQGNCTMSKEGAVRSE
jgi:cytoskeletal protein CcmA (bactofilin family)